MIKEKQQQQAKKKGNDGNNTGGNCTSGGSSGGVATSGNNNGGSNVSLSLVEGVGTSVSDVKESTGESSQTIVGSNQIINPSGSGPEVKEEPDETEQQDSLHETHDSPVDDVNQSPTLQHPPDSTTKDVSSAVLQSTLPSKNTAKTENGDSSDTSFRNDACDGVESVSVGVGVGGGVQPLASNVVPKQPVGLDAQYMQQQSQIFVFSTSLANKAADAVIQGHYTSIIAYHCSQPRTKKYLEGTNRPGGMGGQCGGNTPGGGSMNIDQASRDLKSTGPNNHHQMLSSHMLPDGMMAPLSDVSQDMGLSTPQPLAGVKVPDENLTPQQRQHREEQLATLRKMQQILFPEALNASTEDGSQEQAPSTTHDPNIDLNKSGGGGGSGDWHKLHMQMYEEQKGRGKNGANANSNSNTSSSGRGASAGPPPSYQQATRSASVPIALQSPSPASPNNTTSNLSLPSPRTCSGGINSPHPSDKVPPSPAQVRSAAGASSNPPTPLSNHHLSPKHKDKMSAPNEFSPSSTTSAQNSQQSPVESLYCRTVGQKGVPGAKEPNLMPVPSPQQIQYLNTFEGQELTIQKQPNTSLKESSQKSPPMCVGVGSNNNLENVSGVNTGDKVSGSSPGHGAGTPDVVGNRNFSGELDSSSTDKGNQIQQVSHQRKMDSGNFSTSPHSNDRCHMGVFLGGKCGGVGVSNVYMEPAVMPSKCPGNTGNGSGSQPQEKELNAGYNCVGPDNVPLNPNRGVVPAPGKGSHFDPISSLAQMSQQLTNSVPSSPAAQPISNMHQGMGFNSGGPNQMLMGEPVHHMSGPPQGQMQHFNPRVQCATSMGPAMSVSPKMLQGYPMSQRPMTRMGYNGANIQVKPNAPNTIQYLPSRAQPGGPGNVAVGVGVSVGVGGGAPNQVPPRGAPSLDFLQRFSSPLSNLDTKLPTHNLQYFPNSYPQGNMNEMGMCSGMRPGLRGNNQSGMLRLQPPPPPAQMSPIGFGGSDGFQTNCQLLGNSGGGKGLAPDASQPLPPSMGQANNFKNSAFIGPTTTDPNYAQQFHNFQQQLYATNTRGQIGTQGMPPGQHYFVPKNIY